MFANSLLLVLFYAKHIRTCVVVVARKAWPAQPLAQSLRLTYLKFIPMQTIPNYTFHSALVTLCVKMLL